MSLLRSCTVIFACQVWDLPQLHFLILTTRWQQKNAGFCLALRSLKMKWKLFLDFMDDREKKWLKLDGTGAISQLLECFSCAHETRLGTQLCVKNSCQNPGGWRASSVTWGHDARSAWIRETLLHRVNYKNITAKDNSQTDTVIGYFLCLVSKLYFIITQAIIESSPLRSFF